MECSHDTWSDGDDYCDECGETDLAVIQRDRAQARLEECQFALNAVAGGVDVIMKERDHLRAENERMKAALNDIKRHQEIITGDAILRGATWHIADKALRGEGE